MTCSKWSILLPIKNNYVNAVYMWKREFEVKLFQGSHPILYAYHTAGYTTKNRKEMQKKYLIIVTAFLFLPFKISFYHNLLRTPLVVQEIRMHPPKQGARIQPLGRPHVLPSNQAQEPRLLRSSACSLRSMARGDAAGSSPPTAPGGHLPLLAAIRESQQAATKRKINQNSLS